MKAIIGTKVIEMNKTEAKAAGRFNSEEFKELSALRTAYPDFRIVIKTTKSKDNMKGLTVKYMEKYISTHDDEDGKIMAEFRVLRGLDEKGNKSELADAVSYKTVGVPDKYILDCKNQRAYKNMDFFISKIT